MAEKKKSPKLGGLRRILPGGPFFRRFFITLLVIYTTKGQHTAVSAGLLRAAHPTPNTHTARARRVTGANVGSPGNSTELSHSTRHKYQILHIITVHLSYRLLYFKPPNVDGKLISEAPYFRRFFFVNRRKAIFDVVTGSPFFFYSPNVAEKVFFAQNKTSCSTFFCESPKNLEISRLRRQSLTPDKKQNKNIILIVPVHN